VKIEDGAKRLKDKLGGDTPQMRTYFDAIDKFVTLFMENLVDLDGKAQGTMDNYAGVLTKFGEKKGADSEEVFGHIKSFVDKFSEAYQKYKDEKEKEKKEKKKRKKEREVQARKDKAKGVGNPFGKTRAASPAVEEEDAGGDDDDDDVVDAGGASAEMRGSKSTGSASKANPFSKSASPATSPDAPPAGAKGAKKNPFARVSGGSAAPPEMVVEEPVMEEAAAGGTTALDAAPVAADVVEAPKSPKPERPPPPKADGAAKQSKVNPFAKSVSPSLAGAAIAGGPPKTFAEPPSRQGYLEKQGKEKWSKRWIELDNTGATACPTNTNLLLFLQTPTRELTPQRFPLPSGYFNYFKKKEGKNLGTVFLEGCTVTVVDVTLSIQSGTCVCGVGRSP
jgi:hypothetical protein